ncbi:MAG: MBL fold metallo-hydrolase [Gaiellaceae bacterium]
MAELIDVLHGGIPEVIGVYLVGESEPAIIDCGPSSSVDGLIDGLSALGRDLSEIRHLLLTHIHPDHAGAAGALVQRHPGLQVHVHEIGAAHVVDPTRLLRSATRIYGETFAPLFGSIDPVPEANVHVLSDAVLEFDVVPMPGHAYHQVAFIDSDGVAYPGDTVGCLWGEGDFLYPAAAAPEIDMPAWERSLGALDERGLSALRIPHYGEITDVERHLSRTRERLAEWGALVDGGGDEEQFVAACWRALREEGTPRDAQVFPELPFPSFEMSYAGVRRYFDKAREAAN